MKNKKGFTLIELLAVIVILAIIALIATPIILNMINDARKSAAVDSAYGYIESIEYANSMNMLNSDKYPKIESGNVTSINPKVNLKGTKPDSGEVAIENGKVTSATLIINGYTVKYNGEKAIVEGKDNSEIEEEPEEVVYKCKRAISLHTEECNKTGDGCSADGYTSDGAKKTTTIKYGNLGTKGILTSGDAFDCDVNGDNVYNAENERFYYVTDLDSNTAVLFYYSNTVGGVASNGLSTSYGSNNYNGPTGIIVNLPTTTQWSNISLKQNIRSIVSEKGENFINIRTTSYNLPTNFSYEGYSARFLTYQEITSSCELDESQKINENNCNYLLENINYSGNISGGGDASGGYFLENPYSYNYNNYMAMIVKYTKEVFSANSSYSYGTRPVIEVPKSDIEI